MLSFCPDCSRDWTLSSFEADCANVVRRYGLVVMSLGALAIASDVDAGRCQRRVAVADPCAESAAE